MMSDLIPDGHGVDDDSSKQSANRFHSDIMRLSSVFISGQTIIYLILQHQFDKIGF